MMVGTGLTRKLVSIVWTSAFTLTLFVLATPGRAADTQKAVLFVETGHSRDITSVAFSFDGRLVATGGYDKSIKLWETRTGRQLASFTDSSEVEWVAFLGDRSTLVSGSGKSLTLRSFSSGRIIRTIPLTASAAKAVASSFESVLAVGGDRSVRILHALTGSVEATFKCDDDACVPLRFLNTGNRIAISTTSGIVIWDPGTGATREIKPSAEGSRFLAVAADGSVAEQVGNKIRIRSAETGTETRSFESRLRSTVAFSPDGGILAMAGYRGEIALVSTSVEAVSLSLPVESPEEEVFAYVRSLAFSNDGKVLASVGGDRALRLWDVERGTLLRSVRSTAYAMNSIAFSSDGNMLAAGSWDTAIRIWDFQNGTSQPAIIEKEAWANAVAFSPDRRMLASATNLNALNVWSIATGEIQRSLTATETWGRFTATAFSDDGKWIGGAFAIMPDNRELEFGTAYVWDAASGELRHTLGGRDSDLVRALSFSTNGKLLATGGDDVLRLWNADTGELVKTFDNRADVNTVAFSRDGKLLAFGGATGITLVNLVNYERTDPRASDMVAVNSLAFSPDGRMIAAGTDAHTVELWDTSSFDRILSAPGHTGPVTSVSFSPDGRYVLSASTDGTLKIWTPGAAAPIATLVTFGKNEWLVTTPEGRFDTNKDLGNIDGLHWVIGDDILKPLPLEIFMRQYYEPGLLARLLRCGKNNSCRSEFKPVPPIDEINRVQPKVGEPRVSEIKRNGTVDVSVDVWNSVEMQSLNGTAREVESGIFDLRLFLDGKLAATSVSRSDTERYINSVAGGDPAGEVLIWRDTHDLTKLLKSNDEKAKFVFRDIRIPRNGQGEIQFSAYAFNADRVKSETARTTLKIAVPQRVRGKTVLVTIGVNASESSKYRLDFAANDARRMQEVLGGRLAASGHEVVRVNLVSDHKGGRLTENLATRKIIKGVFDVLGGRREDVDPATLKTIDRLGKFDPVQPEDTLIITYSGHGYTRNGIFYMLPYDIGEHTGAITDDVLPRLISSDELSLWMRDIVAKEMVFIVDACHSAASVQGPDFKPGPMGSRGLGQLAYDKGMRVLAAAQTNNVALELRSLKHGLLSYALLQDGIVRGLADSDTPRDGMLTPGEWLSYAVKGVPALYRRVIQGKAKLAIGGQQVEIALLNEKEKAETFCEGNNCKSKASVQQPVLFDFARRAKQVPMIKLDVARSPSR